MEGYIKLHRQLLDSSQFRNPNTLKVWIWMLLKAAHKPRIVSLKVGKGYTDISLERGQFVFGRNKAQDDLSIDASSIYRILKSLQSDNSIVVKSNNQYSIITICNFDSYNDIDNEDEQPVNNRRTTDEQPMNTNKKDKNVKNKGSKLPLSVAELAFIKLFNELCEREYRTLDEKTRRQFLELLKSGYHHPDFVRTIKMARADMSQRGTVGHLSPDFITRPMEFQKYFNMRHSDKLKPEVYIPNTVTNDDSRFETVPQKPYNPHD